MRIKACFHLFTGHSGFLFSASSSNTWSVVNVDCRLINGGLHASISVCCIICFKYLLQVCHLPFNFVYCNVFIALERWKDFFFLDVVKFINHLTMCTFCILFTKSSPTPLSLIYYSKFSLKLKFLKI